MRVVESALRERPGDDGSERYSTIEEPLFTLYRATASTAEWSTP
jgi:hypothetical protein